MNAPRPGETTPAVAPGAPPPGGAPGSTGGPTADVQLAPPLPEPLPDARLLVGALVLLTVAIVLAWLVARRLRRAPAQAWACRDRALAHLAALRAEMQVACLCPGPAPGSCRAPGPCADAVHRVLLEFATETTGSPCGGSTPAELRDLAHHGRGDPPAALGRLADVLEACDRSRFEGASRQQGCLAEAAIAALRAWPPAAGPGRGSGPGEGAP